MYATDNSVTSDTHNMIVCTCVYKFVARRPCTRNGFVAINFLAPVRWGLCSVYVRPNNLRTAIFFRSRGLTSAVVYAYLPRTDAVFGIFLVLLLLLLLLPLPPSSRRFFSAIRPPPPPHNLQLIVHSVRVFNI